ncbi:hypothetical protein ABMA28_000694 [Loxostege sticticalis]|uniref:Odorant receptor n=1 Tax=Loxostege sticticalis TaxID=481309 RepID=A0ABD0T363_LOXSC
MNTTLGTPVKTNKSAGFFLKVCQLCYLFGFPNCWMESLKFSKTFTKIYDPFSKLTNVMIYLFILTEWGSMFTQNNLTEKQRSDRIMFCLSHPVLCSYRVILAYHREKLQELMYNLCLVLKEKVNDEEIEKGMVRKALAYTSALVGLCSTSLFLYGADGFNQMMRSEATFTTVITAWPLVEDTSISASAARFFLYFMWWVFMSRVFGAFAMLISLIVALEHQYKNLGKYFRNLSGIFEQDLSQAQKEKEYDQSVKYGIKLHAKTLRCTRLAQDSFSSIFRAQILLNTYVLVLLMFQMVAAILPTDMYCSGWHNCRSATGTRKLLALAMLQGQKPVMIKGLGFITISYPAYLSIVKSAYSVFSVLY